MKNMRGIIVLVVAVALGLFAAKMAVDYVKRAEVQRPAPPLAAKPDALPPPPPLFGQAVPEGMRAISIPVDEVTGVSRQVRRGDRVDVLAVSNAPGPSGGRISRRILQAAEVLAAARPADAEDKFDASRSAQYAKKWVVTLLLTPEEAISVTAADASGGLTLVVRNPQDRVVENPTAAMIFTSETGARPYPEAGRQSMPNVRGLIRPGMRAFTLEAKATDGAGGGVRPGDRVDLVLTSPFGHFASSGHDVGAEGRITSTHMASRIFLQNVEVLAVSDRERVFTQAAASEPGTSALPVAETFAERIKTVVLEVTPAEAELLAVATDATSKSMIRLLLRNPNDTGKAATKGQLLIELLTEKHEYTSVEVVRGNQQTTRKFFRYTKGGIATRSEGSGLDPAVDSKSDEEP